MGYVSWRDAQDFVAWLNRAKPAADAGFYRLPSEADWEYAARAGAVSRYWWGDQRDCDKMLCAHWNTLNMPKRPVKAGSYPANAFGLHEMSGNRAEWVEDCYEQAETHGGLPANGVRFKPCAMRVLRGGGWAAVPWDHRSAVRVMAQPKDSLLTNGFRVALSVE